MKLRNLIIVLIIAFIIAIPIVTKTYEGKGQQAVRVLKDLDYIKASAGGNHSSSQSLDLYLPGNQTGKPPLVVFIHGGAWLEGDKADGPGLLLAKQGFACASINYRLSQEAIFPAQINDCRDAVAFLKANAVNYGYDAGRIGVWGFSAGGHLACLLGTAGLEPLDLEKNTDLTKPLPPSSYVQAVVDWAGLTDLESVAQQAGSRTLIDYESEEGPVAKLLGGLAAKKVKLAREASAVTFVNPNCPPFLIVHGDIDNVVPFAQSEELAKALDKVKVPNKLVMVRGCGHGLGSDEEVRRALEFFKQTLKEGKRQFLLGD